MLYITGIQPNNVLGRSGSREAALDCFFRAWYRLVHLGRKTYNGTLVSTNQQAQNRQIHTQNAKKALKPKATEIIN